MRRFYGWGLIFLALLLWIAGCASPAAQGNYIDDLGRTVQIKGIPERIISLSPSNTEIVYALGLQDRLIGVTTYCDYPPEVKDKPRISGYSTVDVEKIVALKPDLILADNIHKTETIPAFERLGFPVLGIVAPTLDKLQADIALIGQATGKEKEASTLNESLKKRIAAVESKTAGSARPRVFFVTWHDPLWTAGPGTMIDDLIAKSGGANIASDLKGNQTISLETAIERNPEIIVVLTSMGDQAVSYNFFKNEPRFLATDALKNNRVYQVDSDIFGRTTPRIVEGLEELAGMVHPELFKEGSK
jgi:iron complex transport system substrate-binding protein